MKNIIIALLFTVMSTGVWAYGLPLADDGVTRVVSRPTKEADLWCSKDGTGYWTNIVTGGMRSAFMVPRLLPNGDVYTCSSAEMSAAGH